MQRRVLLLLAGVMAALCCTAALPAQAAAPPPSDTWTVVSASCKSATLYGSLRVGATSTGGNLAQAGYAGWTSIGTLKTCLEITSTKIRTVAYFIPFKYWTVWDGLFLAWVDTCGGGSVSGTAVFAPEVVNASTSYTLAFVSASLTRGKSYQGAAYAAQGMTVSDPAGNLYTASSPAHPLAQTVKSACAA